MYNGHVCFLPETLMFPLYNLLFSCPCGSGLINAEATLELDKTGWLSREFLILVSFF